MKKQNQSQIDWTILAHLGVLVALLFNVGLLATFNNQNNARAESQDVDLDVMLLMARDCDECFDLVPLVDYLKGSGVPEDSFDFVEYDSTEGKKLIEKYDITKVPTALVFGDVEEYDFMEQLIDSVGEVKKNDFVLTSIQPPYIDLETGEQRGDFEVIYLSDETCEDCYDVHLHDEVLTRLIMTPQKVTELDVSEDEAVTLIEDYGIINVPTLIMRGDLEPYEHLATIWPSVGNIEPDGTYVLRKGVESMGTYKDLLANEIITPETNQ